MPEHEFDYEGQTVTVRWPTDVPAEVIEGLLREALVSDGLPRSGKGRLEEAQADYVVVKPKPKSKSKPKPAAKPAKKSK